MPVKTTWTAMMMVFAGWEVANQTAKAVEEGFG